MQARIELVRGLAVALLLVLAAALGARGSLAVRAHAAERHKGGNEALDSTVPAKFAYRPNPSLYEINTWSWLERLSAQAGHRITLGEVPDAEWDHLHALGFDFVDRPNAFGLGFEFLVDGVEAFVPVPLVGFKLALLVVVEIEQELRVFELPGGLRHPLLLLF